MKISTWFVAFLLLIGFNFNLKGQDVLDKYWFDEAKFGIMVHWGLYTVPAYAPKIRGASPEETVEYLLTELLSSFDLQTTLDKAMASNPYAEWYFNAMQYDYDTRAYHDAKFGEDFLYKDFQPLFEDSILHVDPNKWATYFAEVGAKYVVFVTKHHDGYQLWPSEIENDFQPNYFPTRDFVGEFGEAVRSNGMMYGLYYSGGIDITYRPKRIEAWDMAFSVFPILALNSATPQSFSYAKYCSDQMRELIDKYEPAVLWNDIGYPVLGDVRGLYNYYKRKVPYGWVNDRFAGLISGDFNTPEYAEYNAPRAKKWETVRGMSESFGYNQLDDETDILDPIELRKMFARIIANGGNLLLNISITASGEIKETTRGPLNEFGNWLSTNEEAIFESTYRRPSSAISSIDSSRNVYFTVREGNTYLFFTDSIQQNESVTIYNFTNETGGLIRVLGRDSTEYLSWSNDDDGNLEIQFEEVDGLAYPIVVKVDNNSTRIPTSAISNEQYDFSIYPNPVDDFIRIEGDIDQLSKIKSYVIINATGQVVKTANYNLNTSIDIDNLIPAAYSLVLKSENEALHSVNFVKH